MTATAAATLPVQTHRDARADAACISSGRRRSTRSAASISRSIRGEYVAIMGPSGSGKSTLMNIIGCLDRPTDGDYLPRRRATSSRWTTTSSPRSATARSASSSRRSTCSPRTTALQNVELPLLYAGMPRVERRKLAEEALARGRPRRPAGPPAERSSPAASSSAWPSPARWSTARRAPRRRADRQPRLADQPTRSWTSSSDLHSRGKTIIMVTHETDVAKEAHRVVHIRDGKVS